MRCTDVRCPKHFRLLSPLAKNVSRFRPGGGSFGVRWKESVPPGRGRSISARS